LAKSGIARLYSPVGCTGLTVCLQFVIACFGSNGGEGADFQIGDPI